MSFRRNVCACVDECVIEKEEKKESKLMCFRESAQECLCLSAWVNEMRMSAHERKRERERERLHPKSEKGTGKTD